MHKNIPSEVEGKIRISKYTAEKIWRLNWILGSGCNTPISASVIGSLLIGSTDVIWFPVYRPVKVLSNVMLHMSSKHAYHFDNINSRRPSG